MGFVHTLQLKKIEFLLVKNNTFTSWLSKLKQQYNIECTVSYVLSFMKVCVCADWNGCWLRLWIGATKTTGIFAQTYRMDTSDSFNATKDIILYISWSNSPVKWRKLIRCRICKPVWGISPGGIPFYSKLYVMNLQVYYFRHI